MSSEAQQYRRFNRFVFKSIVIICLSAVFTGTTVYAQTLSLDEAIQQAVGTSYDLKIARLITQISKSDIRIARSEYYPTLKGYINTEYVKDLEGTPTGVTTVGNTVLPSGTRFQNSAGLSLNQTLFDFGANRQRVAIAKTDTQSKALEELKALRDLKLRIVELYTKALITHKNIQAKSELYPLYQQTYTMKNRLYAAGKISKIDLYEDAIQVAQALDELETAKHDLDEQLNTLSYYTHQLYDVDDVEFENMSEDAQDYNAALDIDHTTEAKIFDLNIDKKRQELSLIKRQALPQLSMYTYYNLYGFNPDKYTQSQWL